MTYGSYQVEVRLFNYSNPTGRCCDCPRQNMVRSCCDAFDIFTGPCGGVRGCDSFFLYCLRPLNSTVEGGCANFAKKRSTVNMDDGPINFSQSTVLGLHNPLLLPGLTDAYTVSLAHMDQL